MQAKQATAKLLVARRDPTFDDDQVIAAFHAWIQKSAFGDELLPIDVANYSHVHRGPGIMLVCHEAYVALENLDGRPGLSLQTRRGPALPAADAWRTALRRLLAAAQLLEDVAEGALKFSCESFEVGFNDRLHAPNEDSSLEATRGQLEELGTLLFGGSPRLDRLSNPKACFRVTLSAPHGAPSLASCRQALG